MNKLRLSDYVGDYVGQYTISLINNFIFFIFFLDIRVKNNLCKSLLKPEHKKNKIVFRNNMIN